MFAAALFVLLIKLFGVSLTHLVNECNRSSHPKGRRDQSWTKNNRTQNGTAPHHTTHLFEFGANVEGLCFQFLCEDIVLRKKYG
jgi:hypothetical protein